MKDSHAPLQLSASPLSECGDIIEDWRGLAEAIGANYSLFPEWTRITAESHAVLCRSELVTVRRNGELVAVFPIYFASATLMGLKFRTLEFVSNLVSYHNEPISKLDPQTLLNKLMEIAAGKGADIVHFAGIPDDSELGRHLKLPTPHAGYKLQVIPTESSPFLPISTGWDEIVAQKPKKFRYKLRKRAEAIDSGMSLSTELFTRPEQCAQLLDAIRVVEDNSWKSDVGLSIFQRDRERAYYENLLPSLASKDAMFAHVLFSDDQPIAYNLCCVWAYWVGQLKTSFDSRFAHLSPGSTLIDLGIRRAVDLGATEFDFLGGKDRHKLAWTKSLRAHSDIYLYLKSSIRGYSVGCLKELRLRCLGRV